ncbi:MAG: T9SS type A sorting domain-containing protein [Bacteroidota bacterium]
MKKILSLITIFLCTTSINKTHAQNVMQLTGPDCNGINHNLYADLDAGKAVILHFFMPNCGSCPPPAQKIQTMANHILATHPGMITAYAMPYNNTATCAYTSSWVSSNNLSLYAPYDSGAVQVANYGGFGMPTVVVLGGAAPNRRVMFVTQSFSTSDTTVMRDSILNLFQSTTGLVSNNNSALSNLKVFPNPANEALNIHFETSATSDINLSITDLNGKEITSISKDKFNAGEFDYPVNVAKIPSGLYLVNLTINGASTRQKVTIKH